MGKGRKSRQSDRRQSSAAITKKSVLQPSPVTARITGWKLWLFRAVLCAGIPLICLVLIELGLRLGDYGHSTNFFEPTADGQAFTVNENFACQFYSKTAAAGKAHPFLMRAKKGEQTIRIFLLGESAAQGTPNPAFGFGRMLEFMLQRSFPQKKIEVLNAAMRGVNSHIILPIARECAQHDPDLFLVYMGNNEVVGLHAPGPDSGFLNKYLWSIRIIRPLRATRLGQMLANFIETRAKKNRPVEEDMDFFRARRLAFEDQRRLRVYQNFEANLDEMCRVMLRSEAKVLLSTVPANLKDFPPIAALHRSDLTEIQKTQWEADYAQGRAAEDAGRFQEAVQGYLRAAAVDDHFADLHFRLARCFFSTGDFTRAAGNFALARDRDALQFRCDTPINMIVRNSVRRFADRGVELVDAEKALAKSELADHGIAGRNVFYDHVHFRFDGDYFLARTLFATITNTLGAKLGAATHAPLPTRQECAARLAFTSWDELQADLSMAKMMGHPPFLDQVDHAQLAWRSERELKQRADTFNEINLKDSVAIYKAALQDWPDDWELHHDFGMLNFFTENFSAAAEQLAYEVKQFPRFLSNRLPFSAALARAGKVPEAREQLREALRIDPHFKPAKDALAALEKGTFQPR